MVGLQGSYGFRLQFIAGELESWQNLAAVTVERSISPTFLFDEDARR